MKIFTKRVEDRLRANAKKSAHPDFKSGELTPVVKVFNPYGGGTWLLTEMDEDGRCFGLCDLGFGFPELGYVTRRELESTFPLPGCGLERDKYFHPRKNLREYAEEAREKGRIAA